MTDHSGKLWLIGGTEESRLIVLEILTLNLPCIITVTTKEAERLYPKHSCLKVRCGALSSSEVPNFLLKENIRGIIDASHPYAVEISQLAMKMACDHHISYLRYERSNLSSNHGIFLESFEDLLTDNYLLGKRVFLTVGYKALPPFKTYQEKAVLYARILPKVESLQVAVNSGFTPDRLIAFRPPLDYAMEKALWQHWDIEVVVSKASGNAGGEDIKQQLSQRLDIPLIIIKRPEISYIQKTDNLQEIKEFLDNFA